MVNQVSQAQTNRPHGFFQTPRFWLGCVLWLLVVVAVVGIVRQRQTEKTRDPSVAADADTAKGQSDDEQPKKLVLKQDKDGNFTIGEPAKDDSASPWDADGIADFAFTDTGGKTVTKGDLLGKPWIVCFVFTHCAATCPTVTQSMRELQDQLKDRDFHLVTLTVDPVRDTPEVLKGYGERYRADFNKWFFLGGDQRDIYQLIHGSFKMPVQELFGDKRQTGFEFIHSNNIMLVDEKGVVQGKFDATKGTEMASLRREIQKMAKSVSKEVGDSEQPIK